MKNLNDIIKERLKNKSPSRAYVEAITDVKRINNEIKFDEFEGGKVMLPKIAIGMKPTIKDTPKDTPEEEWIWVEGYKGTDLNMCCRGYQFELGKRFDIPEDEEIETCAHGFHFCNRLDSVYSFYKVGDGNRFFAVRALVRKSDWEKSGGGGLFYFTSDKCAARSIEFIKELTPHEVLSATRFSDMENWTEADKREALLTKPEKVEHRYRRAKLITLGYSETFASYLTNDRDYYERAVAIASQEGVSMDVKVLFILGHDD